MCLNPSKHAGMQGLMFDGGSYDKSYVASFSLDFPMNSTMKTTKRPQTPRGRSAYLHLVLHGATMLIGPAIVPSKK